MEYLERGTHLPGLREALVTTGENKPQLRQPGSREKVLVSARSDVAGR